MSATLPSTHTPEGAGDNEVNIRLDALILRRERPDYDAAWFGRRFFATACSTVKKWFQ